MTITAGTVMALAYSGGVAVATDRTAFSGRTPRFQNSTRQYRLNDFCLVSFSGDFADFQWLQNLLERHQIELQNSTRQYRLNDFCLVSFSGDFADFQWLQNLLERHQIELQIDAGMDYMKPKMVHAFLASLFYQRRSKMNPILNTVVVSGMQQVDFHAGKTRPFIGIVDIRGSAYERLLDDEEGGWTHFIRFIIHPTDDVTFPLMFTLLPRPLSDPIRPFNHRPICS
uniref:Proteasome subunit beta n=1 Tax=Globodera pallida TaxID=36090 RepID=A0A183CLL6_GLOPA